MEAAASRIQEFGHCGCVSTEVLAYLYESALIDKYAEQSWDAQHADMAG